MSEQTLVSPVIPVPPRAARAETRRSPRHRRTLKARWRQLGASGYTFAPAQVRDISRGGIALLLNAPIKRGTILTVQLEGVPPACAEPLLVRVTHAAEQGGKWLAGCTFTSGLTETQVQALLQSVDTPPARGPVEAPAAPKAVRPADPFVQGSARERRSSPRRSGSIIQVLISRISGAARFQGWVADRSLGGLGLTVPCPFTAGSLLKIRVQSAPESIPWVQIRVKTCRPRGKEWVLGCEFTASVTTTVRLLFG